MRMISCSRSEFGQNFEAPHANPELTLHSVKKKSSVFARLLLVWLAVLGFTGTAHAWWNSEWTLRKKITVDTSAINDPIGATAVLLRLHDGDFKFAEAKEDGGDLRFVAEDDKTPLTYHIERFDPVLNEAFVWVKIPDVKPKAKVSFWLYYGNAGPKVVKADDPKGTYDADTVLVYHFGEKSVGGVRPPPSDSSPAGNTAQNSVPGVEASMIGGGVRFDGSMAITVPASPTLGWADGAAVTWSAWVKLAALQPNAVIFSRRDGANGFAIGVDNGIPYVEVTDASGPHRSGGTIAAIAAGSWRHCAVTAANSKITLFIDGEPAATLPAATPALNGPLLVGGDASAPAATPDAVVGAGFSGELDELEISKTERPSGFLKLAAASQGGEQASKYLTLGEDEQQTSWFSWLSTGYFGVIFKSLTVDGWVVICILAVMGVISWVVMITKVSYLNGISKGNALFMKEWSHVASDLTVLEDADSEKLRAMGGRVDKAGQRAMRAASVYRIYHIGIEEIRHRLANDLQSGSRKALSGRSIQAIRASLDGGLIRETQKINRLIVLLTICISGGPFLGLLGTVVGVMITFAAVAAAGEVNVNAIAPGIAAALLATVAGLFVAIPSLFGYNYILSRVKDATADMHVFIDEFVTKMAEFYRERAE